MAFLPLLFVAVLILVWIHHFWRRRKDPPGPLGVPIFGTIPGDVVKGLLGKRTPIVEYHQELARKYGPIVSLEVGLQKFIILNTYDVIREALIENGELFSGRPQEPFYKFFSEQAGIVSIDGEKWREHRRFALRVLRNFGMGKGLIQVKIVEEAQYSVDMIAANLGKPIEISDIFVKAVSNVISVLVFGQRWGYDDERFLEYVGYIKSIAQGSGLSTFLPIFFPFLAKPTVLKMLPGCQAIVHDNEMLKSVIRDRFHQHQTQYNVDDEPTNVIEALLHEKHLLDQRNEPHTFDEVQCVKMCFDLFIAGTETTTTSMGWAMVMLSLHQDIQTKLHNEIDRVIGRERPPDVSDRKTLPYTQAFLDEIMRFCTIVPRAVDRRVMEDTKFRGYDISTHTIIFPNVYGVHRDPKFWSHPYEFYPEHFLSASGEYRSSEYLMPFGMGKRICIGESLAQMEFFIFLVSTMQRYSVDLDADSKKGIDEILIGSEGVIHAPAKHEVILSARD